MSMMTATRKTGKTTPPFSCEFVAITLRINDTKYACDELPAVGPGTRTFRLCKHSGDHEIYDVCRTGDLTTCSCPSYAKTHAGTSSMCKHARAIVTLGLLPSPAVAPTLIPQNDGSASVVAEPSGNDCHLDAAPATCCDQAEPVPCAACIPAALDAPPAASWPSWTDQAWTIADEPTVEPPTAEPEGHDDHLRNESVEPAPVDPTSIPHDIRNTGEPTDVDLADYRGWKSETTAREYLDPRPTTFTLAELIDHQRRFYEGWDNPVGRLLDDHMGTLAFQCRLTSATTPGELVERVRVLDEDARQQWEEAGRQSCACQHEPAGLAWGHMA